MKKLLCALFLSVILPARGESDDCARLLMASPPAPRRVLTADQEFQAYMRDLLVELMLETEDLLPFKAALEEGRIINPVTEKVILRNAEAWIHQEPFQKKIDRGELTVPGLLRWVEEELAAREYDRERQRVTREETRETTIEDLFPEVKMVKIPGGEFRMGSPERQVDVTLDPFEMMDAQVTQEMWEGVMGEKPSEFVGTNRPVEMVSHNDIQKFLARLNVQLGLKGDKRYRLPTEAQWEYAARAGTTTAYFFGDDPNLLGEYAVFDTDSTAPVRSKLPNQWGLYDMSGNVWEWTEDWYHEKLPGGSNPMQTKRSDFRVIRGGSWDYYAQYLRSADRSYDFPDGRGNNVGFRLVRQSQQ